MCKGGTDNCALAALLTKRQKLRPWPPWTRINGRAKRDMAHALSSSQKGTVHMYYRQLRRRACFGALYLRSTLLLPSASRINTKCDIVHFLVFFHQAHSKLQGSEETQTCVGSVAGLSRVILGGSALGRHSGGRRLACRSAITRDYYRSRGGDSHNLCIR